MRTQSVQRRRLMRTWRAGFAAVSWAMVTSVAVGQASEVDLLTPPTGAHGDELGRSIAVSGDVAVVGAPGDAWKGADTGSVTTYRFDGAKWVFEQRIRPRDGQSGDRFGTSVGLSLLGLTNDRLIVGVPGDDDVATDAGSAYVYTFDGVAWRFEMKLMPPGARGLEACGMCLATDGLLLALGAPGKNIASRVLGTVFLYRMAFPFGWVEEATLSPPDPSEEAQFGLSVALDADRVVVGAPGRTVLKANEGAVYSFVQVDGDWDFEQRMVGHSARHGARLGTSVGVRDGRIAAGAPFMSRRGHDSGAVFLFRFDGSTWVDDGALSPGGAKDDDRFGASLALGLDELAVGAPGRDDAMPDAGTVHLFEERQGVWAEVARYGSSGADVGDALGASVALHDERAFAGAPHASGSGSVADSGLAAVFRVGAFQLTAAPDPAFEGDLLELVASYGRPTDRASLFLLELNGLPFFVPLAVGTFSRTLQFRLDAEVPPGLSGNDLGLAAAGEDAFGSVRISNLASVRLR